MATAIAVLKQRFGERVQTGEAIRAPARQHGDRLPNEPPDAVVWPQTTEEVVETSFAAHYAARSSPSAPGPRSRGTSTPLMAASRSTSRG